MAEAFDLYAFPWWRFSKYELKGGYICPAPGAKLELYDPWKPYRDSWENDPDSATPFAETRQQGPPYLSLIDLANDVKFTPDKSNLDKKSADQLLKWCSEFGLLGILPQRVLMVALTPRWLPEKSWKPALGLKQNQPKNGKLYPSQFNYYRDPAILLKLEGIWVQGWSPSVWCDITQGQKDKRLGQIYEGKTPVQPGVLIQDMRFAPEGDFPSVKIMRMVFQEPFKQTWARFFPSIPKKQIETYLYPPPFTPPFWEIYSESVSDFFMGVFALRDALLSLNGLAPSDPQQPPSRSPGFSLLNNLVSASSMAIAAASDGSLSQEWCASSLLGCFAMMALQDLTLNRKVIRCEKCNRLFVSEAYQARYCSDKCRHTAQKRRYRQRLKEKEES